MRLVHELMKVVLASNNSGKIKELNELLKKYNIHLISQAELGVKEIEETGLSFIENAILKARHASQITKLPALADDSGLAVDILHGEPGIYSARYAGVKVTDKDNINKLLDKLKGVPKEKRKASFHCALVFMAHAADPTPLVCEGTWFGVIASTPVGENGFGYDPIFYVPSENKTAAELSADKKNKLSHRGIALQYLIKMLPEKI